MDRSKFVNEENVINSIVAFFAAHPTNFRLDLFKALKLYNENDFLAYVSDQKIINNLLTDGPLYSICINLGEKLQPHGLAIYRYGKELWVIRYDNPEYLDTIDKKEKYPIQKKFNMGIREYVSRKSAIAIPSVLDVKESASIAPSLVSTPALDSIVLDSPVEFPKLASGFTKIEKSSVFRKIGKSTENSLTFASMVKASPSPSASPLCVVSNRHNTVTPISEIQDQYHNRLNTMTPMSQVSCGHSWAECNCSDGEDETKPGQDERQPVLVNHFTNEEYLFDYDIGFPHPIKIPIKSSLLWINPDFASFDVKMNSITLNGEKGMKIQISATIPSGETFYTGEYCIKSK